MADLEKVIKGLGCCRADPISVDECEAGDCPYLCETNCIDKLFTDALELLKEQEAQPAIIEGSDVICIGRCPSCKTVLQPGRANYCYNCGRAVKWDD